MEEAKVALRIADLFLGVMFAVAIARARVWSSKDILTVIIPWTCMYVVLTMFVAAL